MMTRRSFLQALLSLPVVAAIPQFAALVFRDDVKAKP